uniref:Uncharacterized protein n=1 Tax=Lepeophtheirus salmonis TaxID=72036 RepID=A0A0K2VAH2_LEPSM
MGMFDYLLYQL